MWANGQRQPALSHKWTSEQDQPKLSEKMNKTSPHYQPALFHKWTSGQMDKVASDQPALSHMWTSFKPAWVDLDLDLLVDGGAATVREHLDRHARYVLCIIDATAI
ncbi:hypothetical protein DPMN_069689 [Dreissena polymorpha]|uniref:Uncharacterized protein n=1 Tax=Dreissena polymorpha TaxID=45954 RepID=A0A9D3Z000_DREPO|nr:hypothetical protein DPMN_069689 [Dreissena polymorpha]